MSGRFIQIAFAIGYLAMLCLALFLFSGCSRTAPMPSHPVASSESVKLKVELGESNGSQLNATVTKSGRQLQTSVTKDEYGTTVVTHKFRPGEEEASERETLYTGLSGGKSLTIEKLNWNGQPRELKSWMSKDSKDEPTRLYRHAIFALDGTIQWQEIYGADGSVCQRSRRTKSGGMENFYTDEKKQAWLVRQNSAGKAVERIDYVCEGGLVREYHKWSGTEEHLQLEWRRWYSDGTLEVEQTRDDQGFSHTKWYRQNGALKIASKALDHKDRDRDSWVEFYKEDGRTVWRKTQYVARVRTNFQFSESGTVEVVHRIDCNTGDSIYTLMHPRGHKIREIEWKAVPYTWKDKASTAMRMLRADKMDEQGRLAVRYSFHVFAGPDCLAEMAFYREGVLFERQVIGADKAVTRMETIGSDGKVVSAVDVLAHDRKPVEVDETVSESISEKDYNTDDVSPDRISDGFARRRSFGRD